MTKYQSSDDEYTIVSKGKKLAEWYHVLSTVAPDTLTYDDKGKMIIPKILYYHYSNFSGGSLLMISNQKPSDEAKELQRRAAGNAAQFFQQNFQNLGDIANRGLTAEQQRAQIGGSLGGNLLGQLGNVDMAGANLTSGTGTQLANQAFGQQRNLATQQQQLQNQDVSQLGLLGGLQQAQAQSQLTATQEGNRLRAMEPYERMGQYGSGVMGLISGMGNQYQSQVTPNPTPLQTALSTGAVLGGIFNPPK